MVFPLLILSFIPSPFHNEMCPLIPVTCWISLRLAWHASGTYSKKEHNGGSDGATMRFKAEAEDAANAGLDVARQVLEPVKAKHQWIPYADLWT